MFSIWVFHILVFTIISHMCFKLTFNGLYISFISINIQSFWCCSMACFFVIPFLVFVFSSTGWWERPPRDLRLLTSIHGWWLGNNIGGAHNWSTCFNFSQMFGIDSKSYPTFIKTIMAHTSPCSCRGVHSSNMCISFKHTYNPLWWNHESPSLSPPTC